MSSFRIDLFSLTKVVTLVNATERFFIDAASSLRSPSSIEETSERAWAKSRTVWSFSDSVLMKPSSCLAELKNCSSRLSSVLVSLPRSPMVELIFSPSPPRFFAVCWSRSVRAPFLLAPSGPSATTRSSTLE